MNDYVIGRCSRRCRISDRPLEPGERFYSVAVAKAGEILRFDIAEASWSGPPQEAVGWWRGRMPQEKSRRSIPTPNRQLVEQLSQLCEDPNQQTLAYLLGVLLVRRKVLRESTDEEGPSEREPSHQSLIDPTSDQRFLVPIAEPDAAAAKGFQEALQALLFTEG